MKKICPHAILNHIAEGEDLRWTREELKAALVALENEHSIERRTWLAVKDAAMSRTLDLVRVFSPISTDAIAKAAKDSREVKA